MLVGSPEEAIQNALEMHPDCSHGEWKNGMNCMLQLTIVVELW